MKNMKYLVWLLSFFVFSGTVWSDNKKVTVVPFKEEGEKSAGLGRYTANILTEYLFSLGSVDIVDRDNLSALLKEQQLELTGLIGDSFTNVGKISGVDYLISGTVMDADLKRVYLGTRQVLESFTTTHEKVRHTGKSNTTDDYILKTQEKYKNEKVWVWQGSVALELRIIDTVSGKLLFVTTKDSTRSGQKHQSLVREAIDDALNEMKTDLYNFFRPTGTLQAVQIIDKKVRLTMDFGTKSGIRKGYICEVFTRIEPVQDPVTGHLVQSGEHHVMDVKITETGESVSYAYIPVNKAGLLKKGMLVRLKSKKRIFGCL